MKYNIRYNGFIFPVTLIFVGVSVGITFSYFSWVNNKNLNLKYRIAVTQALYNAETGISEKVLPMLYSSTFTDEEMLLEGEIVESSEYENEYFGYYDEPEIWRNNFGRLK